MGRVAAFPRLFLFKVFRRANTPNLRVFKLCAYALENYLGDITSLKRFRAPCYTGLTFFLVPFLSCTVTQKLQILRAMKRARRCSHKHIWKNESFDHWWFLCLVIWKKSSEELCLLAPGQRFLSKLHQSYVISFQLIKFKDLSLPKAAIAVRTTMKQLKDLWNL